MQDRLSQGKGMDVTLARLSDSNAVLKFCTQQTLAPNYNESIQIDDFLFAIGTLGEIFEQIHTDLGQQFAGSTNEPSAAASSSARQEAE